MFHLSVGLDNRLQILLDISRGFLILSKKYNRVAVIRSGLKNLSKRQRDLALDVLPYPWVYGPFAVLHLRTYTVLYNFRVQPSAIARLEMEINTTSKPANGLTSRGKELLVQQISGAEVAKLLLRIADSNVIAVRYAGRTVCPLLHCEDFPHLA